MHRYLRSIGFGNIDTKPREVKLLAAMDRSPRCGGENCEEHESSYAALNCEVADGMGVFLYGYRDAGGKFIREFYYPYLIGEELVQMNDAFIKRHCDNESYAVLCEEYRMGSALIFHMTNGISFRERVDQQKSTAPAGAYLTGLSDSGNILLPIQKTEKQQEVIRSSTIARTQKMEAAREGDEAAIESLTMDEINLYNELAQRIQKEDIYSIVDSSFMPSGVECDSYTVIGEILKCSTVTNSWTQETVWKLQLECNGLNITVGINDMDLLGEPMVGRRFKGDIWLQGYVLFDDEVKS